MPRQAKQLIKPLPDQTLVLDNGGYTIKAGFASSHPDPSKDCYVVPNCIAKAKDKKIYIADQVENCYDFAEMAFRRPVEKGYLVNWDSEMDIWRHTLFDKGAKLQCEPHETNLVLTEAPNCPHPLQSNCDQIIFEEFEFASYYRCMSPVLDAYNDITSLMGEASKGSIQTCKPVDCLLLIDSGYSHTTITPLISGKPVQSAVRRLNIGGKTLTNRLKELISLRHYSMMDEPYLVNEIKEDSCFVSLDFNGDLDSTWKGGLGDIPKQFNSRKIVVDYVLPDYTPKSMRGYVRPHDPSLAAKQKRLGVAKGTEEDYLPLGNERFVVPELLFRPNDIGMREAGIPELIAQSLSVLPEGLWPAMVANIVAVGGNCKIPGFQQRLDLELRSLIADKLQLRLRVPDDPITYTWLGGARMASNKDTLSSLVVTKAEYEEIGSSATTRKFLLSNR